MARLPKFAPRSYHSPLPGLVLLGALTASACADGVPTEATIALPIVAYSHEGHADTNGRSFDLAMTQEVTATFVGDPDGVGTALLTINAGLRKVCWRLTVSNILLPSTGAHIHRAPAGLAGPIVVPLTAPDAGGNASGCASVERDLLVDILRNSSAYYVNVHSAEYPPGAVRSQLR